VGSSACLLTLGVCFCLTASAQNELVPTFGTTVVIPSGLQGVVYHLHHNTKQLPDLRKKKPAGTIYTTSLNIPPQDFKQGFPGVTKRFEWFAINYTGKFWIDKPGKYRFALTSDDGAKLYIDDQLVVDNDGQHPPETKSASFALSGGVHRIQVSYFQGPRFQVALLLQVAGPGQEMRVFSTDEFKPPPNPETWAYPETANSEKEAHKGK
jgi:hypothetical protein